MNRFKGYFLVTSSLVILAITWMMMNSGRTLAQPGKPTKPDWAFNASIIEACSCPMFCPCYFTTQPAAHGGHGSHGAAEQRFCRANFAYQVNQGYARNVKLDGARFWVALDTGDDFSDKEFDWAVLYFDPSVTKAQREAITVALTHLYPYKWKSFTVGKDAPVEWHATKDRAEARLDGGKMAEVVLRRNPGMTDGPVVIKNLKYWGAPRNSGFILMPNEIEAYRVGDKAFEFKGTNGFMITVDINSGDIKK